MLILVSKNKTTRVKTDARMKIHLLMGFVVRCSQWFDFSLVVAGNGHDNTAATPPSPQPRGEVPPPKPLSH